MAVHTVTRSRRVGGNARIAKQIPEAVRKAIVDVVEAPKPAPHVPARPHRANAADIVAVTGGLHDAAYALLAVHRLAIDAQDADGSEWYLQAIKELARSSFRRIDASIERLTGRPAIGNFATEFDID